MLSQYIFLRHVSRETEMARMQVGHSALSSVNTATRYWKMLVWFIAVLHRLSCLRYSSSGVRHTDVPRDFVLTGLIMNANFLKFALYKYIHYTGKILKL